MRPDLKVGTPGGVLKGGCPGSDGEPGCGFSWLPAWHPGGGPQAPWARVEGQAIRLSAVHTWKNFHSYPGSHVRGLPMPTPPPLHSGLAGFVWRAGFPLQLSSEWAPRRGEKAPRGHVVSRAKGHIVCFSAVCALTIFHSHSGIHALLYAPPRPLPLHRTPPTLGGGV